jgi:hypothetical protein
MWKWFIPLAAGVAIAVGVAAIRAQSTGVHVAGGSRSGTTAPTSTATTGPAALRSTCGSLTGAPATYRHVIWIWMSDESYTDEIGARGALFTNQLASECGLATNYAAITHPDVPNEVAALSGGTQGLTRQGCAPCTTGAASLLTQVGGSWKVYAEGMHAACQRTASGYYLPLSNPGTFFTSAACRSHDVPMGTVRSGPLASALASGRLPRFTMLVPHVCNSGSGVSHRPQYKGCGQSKHVFQVARADSWLQAWMERIVKSPAYQSGGTVVMVTWDQGSPPSRRSSVRQVGLDCPKLRTGGCRVATLIVSPYVHPHTWVSQPFSHYSLLRTTEELLGIHVFLGAASGAHSMRRAFGL